MNPRNRNRPAEPNPHAGVRQLVPTTLPVIALLAMLVALATAAVTGEVTVWTVIATLAGFGTLALFSVSKSMAKPPPRRHRKHAPRAATTTNRRSKR